MLDEIKLLGNDILTSLLADVPSEPRWANAYRLLIPQHTGAIVAAYIGATADICPEEQPDKDLKD